MSFPLDEAPRRLLDRGLVGPAELVDGALEVAVVARRNLSLRLRRGSGPTVLVKQCGAAGSSRETLGNEGRFYELCRDAAAAAPLSDLVPPLVAFDAAEAVVAVEWLEKAVPLWAAYRGHERLEVPRGVLRALGRALALLHEIGARPDLGADPRVESLPDVPPSFLSAHRAGPRILRQMTRGQREVLRLLQEHSEIGRELESAAASWRRETLIHGDLRGGNILVRGMKSPRPAVFLVDWELVRRGDRAWDLGGVLADTLSFWVAGMSHRADRTPAQRDRSALYPLASIQPALRAFWRAYLAASGLAPDAESLRGRAVPYAAARLIQFAWEYGGRLDDLSPRVVLLIQLAANILARPEKAQTDLFGLAKTTGGKRARSG